MRLTSADQGFRDGSDASLAAPSPTGPLATVILRISRALLVTLVLGLGAYIAGIAVELNAEDTGAEETGAEAVHIDFVAFWAAAKLALAGEPAAAFDPARLVAAQSLADPGAWDVYGWHYLPTFLLLLTPLGALAFTPAFAVFSVAALGLYAWALGGWARPLSRAAPAIAAPPVAFVLATGNASLLWAAALLAALACLRSGREAPAGLLIALLTLKPQLGLLIPVALVAGRRWRALIWAATGAAGLALASIAAFGGGIWLTFLAAMAETAEVYAVHGQNAVTMVTWYAWGRQFGLGHETALALQALFVAAAAVMVWLVWSRREVAFDLKAAALCLGALISTPYAFQYELVLAVVAALFLARSHIGGRRAGLAWLAVLWALPLPGWIVPGLEIAAYAAPVLAASLAATVHLALRRRAVAVRG